MPITMDPIQECSDLHIVVERTLRRLRISGKLKGFRFLRYALTVTVKDPYRTDLITKVLYPEIAAEFSDKDTRVERAIRTAICACWDSYGRDELNKMAVYTLEKRPTNLEFIDLVAAYIRYILDR